MSPSSSFEFDVADWSLGGILSDRLPKVATDALAAGIESPSLIELANEPPIPDAAYHRLFERALGELGRPVPRKVDAARIMTIEFARRICASEASPIEGARFIQAVEDSTRDEFFWNAFRAVGGRL
jgi:hypothetical protein